MKNQEKMKALLYVMCGCVKCGAMETNIECLCGQEIEALENFKLMGF